MATVITVIGGIILAFSLGNALDKGYWSSVFSSALGQALALIIGIPIALWIERENRSAQYSSQVDQERTKERKLLTAIRQELLFNRDSIHTSLRKNLGQPVRRGTLHINQYETEVWDTLKESGEVAFVAELELQNRIAGAYHVIKEVRFLENLAIERFSNNKSNFGGDGLGFFNDKAEEFDSLLDDSIAKALEQIDARLQTLPSN